MINAKSKSVRRSVPRSRVGNQSINQSMRMSTEKSSLQQSMKNVQPDKYRLLYTEPSQEEPPHPEETKLWKLYTNKQEKEKT